MDRPICNYVIWVFWDMMSLSTETHSAQENSLFELEQFTGRIFVCPALSRHSEHCTEFPPASVCFTQIGSQRCFFAVALLSDI